MIPSLNPTKPRRSSRSHSTGDSFAEEPADRIRRRCLHSSGRTAATPGVKQIQPEPGDSMSAFISKTMTALADQDTEDDGHLLPRAPRSFAEVGLSKAFLTDLTLKIIHYSGTPSMTQLVRRLGLNPDIVSQLLTALSEDRLVEVMSQSDLYTGNYRYRLSQRGEARVSEALERTRYAGPAPVTAEQYKETMQRILALPQDESARAHVKVESDVVVQATGTDGQGSGRFFRE
jgi:DNA-binding MarR family transcriptional regulator